MMFSAQRIIPPDLDTWLCEGCGYALTGLPGDSRCPECGRPIVESVGPDVRLLPAWERPGSAGERFFRTIGSVLFRPTRFYRTLRARHFTPASGRFARICWGATAVMLGLAGFFHAVLYLNYIPTDSGRHWLLLSLVIPSAYVLIWLTHAAAARLTAWEAGYRGLRLPLAVVSRGMHYHAAHYLPVAFVGWATVTWFGTVHHWVTGRKYLEAGELKFYLYLLCGEVILGAVYLFHTYWIAMRNLMYANR